ncbi:MAG TPA: ABC transporter substrate-binding protein [Acetobacteraceae bacterium]|nr:ABC transporter substrate-binding protein [Acetobacteraceae bacterium]
MKRRTFNLGAAGAAVSAFVPRLSLAQQGAKRGGEVTIAMVAPPPSLDAHITSAQAARNITLHIFETLYARDEKAKPVPELATGVNVSQDGKTYVFPIRQDVTFHNGKKLDAQDVVASIERYRKLGASATLLSAVDSVRATGPHEVTIALKQVQSTFLDNLSSPRAPIAIYPAAEAAKGANQIDYIGTGPYRFVEYRPDSHCTIARYDGYSPNPAATARDGFAGKKEVFLDRVTFRFMVEAGPRNAAFEAGEVQLVETVDGPTAKRWKDAKHLVIYKALPFGFQVIKFNHALGATGDLNFRLAVQSALEMEDIMAIAYPDIYAMDGVWVYPGSPYYTKQGTEAYNKPDMAAAKALLAKSGYKGETLIFITDPLRPNADTATMVQERLKELGVKIEIQVADWPTVSKIGYTPTGWNFWTHGFGIEPYEGPASVMAPWVGGNSQQKPDAEVDRLYAAYNAELDEAKRKAIFAEFQKRFYDQAIAMKAGNYGYFQVATSRLKNFAPYRIPRMWGVWLEAQA